LLGARLLVRALWYSLRLQVLPDEQRRVAVNSLEEKYTQHSYNILHDRRARGEHSRLVGAFMPPYMAPPVLNRCNSRFGCQHIFCFAADAIPPRDSGMSFPVDRSSAALVGRDAVRAKARNFHFSFLFGTLVIPTSLS
jgi:hypothetical protein